MYKIWIIKITEYILYNDLCTKPSHSLSWLYETDYEELTRYNVH